MILEVVLDEIKLTIEPHELFLLMELIQERLLCDGINDPKNVNDVKNFIVRFMANESLYRKTENCCDKNIHDVYGDHKKRKMSVDVEKKIGEVFKEIPPHIQSAVYSNFINMNKQMTKTSWE